MYKEVGWNCKFDKTQGLKCKDGKALLSLFEIKDWIAIPQKPRGYLQDT
jgi:hypothetical protein